jgi:hypothetical protein
MLSNWPMEMELHDGIYHVQPGGTLSSGCKHRGSFKRCASASLLPLENCILIYGAGGTWQGDRMRHLEVQSSNIDTHADAKSYSVLEMRV